MPVEALTAVNRDSRLPDEFGAEALIDGAWQDAPVASFTGHPWQVWRVQLENSYPYGTEFRSTVVIDNLTSEASNVIAYVPEPGVIGLLAGAVLIAGLGKRRAKYNSPKHSGLLFTGQSGFPQKKRRG